MSTVNAATPRDKAKSKQSKPKSRRKPRSHYEYLPVIVKYDHYTKARLEGYEYFQDGVCTEDSIDWVCGLYRKATRCTAQLTTFRDGRFTRRKSHNHATPPENVEEKKNSWQTYKTDLAEVFNRIAEKKKTGDKMFYGGFEFMCKACLQGRCYWSCMQLGGKEKCAARLITWYDGAIFKANKAVHNHKAPELTAGQRIQQEYDAWYPKQWTALVRLTMSTDEEWRRVKVEEVRSDGDDGFVDLVDHVLRNPFHRLCEGDRRAILSLDTPRPNVSIVQQDGKSCRKFQPFWYMKYPWLTGSVARSRVFCYPCLLMDATAPPFSHWSRAGIDTVKNFVRKAEKHRLSSKHEWCLREYEKAMLAAISEVVWRCTKKSCVGSVRTDYEVQTLLEVSGSHDHVGLQPLQPSRRVIRRRPGQAPQPPPPPPPQAPLPQQPPPQLKRPVVLKPLVPKASPPQPPPPPPPEVCLRWNSYHSNMQASFPALLNNEQFVDVTLACEGRSIKCHKMILSACSSYFDELLSQNPCQHPIVLMKDLKFWEVQALVEFMYRGEVNVSQDKLPFLLAAAEALQIKGLASPTSSTPQHDEDSMTLGMDLDYMDDLEVPSPSSSRRSRKRRTIAAIPMQATPSPTPVPTVIRSTRHQRNNQPSTSGYIPIQLEPPTRKRKLDGPEFDAGEHLMREIKLEPVDIDASSDSMDHSSSELFQMTCEPTPVFHPTMPNDVGDQRSDARRDTNHAHPHPPVATAPDIDMMTEGRRYNAATTVANGATTITPCAKKPTATQDVDTMDLNDRTALQEVTRDAVAQDIVGEVAQEIAGEVAQDIAGEVAQDIAGEVAQDIAGEVAPDKATDTIHENGTDDESKPHIQTQNSEPDTRSLNEDTTLTTNQEKVDKKEELPAAAPSPPPLTSCADEVKAEEN